MKRKAGGPADLASSSNSNCQVLTSQSGHQPQNHVESSQRSGADNDQEYEKKLLKSLDLTDFVNYIKGLYNQDDSASESGFSDNESSPYLTTSPLSVLATISESQHNQIEEHNRTTQDTNAFSTVDLNENSSSTTVSDEVLRFGNHTRCTGKTIKALANSESASMASSARSSVNGSITTKSSSCSSSNNSTLSDEDEDSLPIFGDSDDDSDDALDDGNNSDSDLSSPLSDHEISQMLAVNRTYSSSGALDSIDYIDALVCARKISRLTAEHCAENSQTLISKLPSDIRDTERRIPQAISNRDRIRKQERVNLRTQQTIAGAMSTFKTPLVSANPPSQGLKAIKLEPVDTYETSTTKSAVQGRVANVSSKRGTKNLPSKLKRVESDINEQLDMNTSHSTLSLDSYFKDENKIASLKTRSTSSASSIDKKLNLHDKLNVKCKKLPNRKRLELLNLRRKKIYILICKKEIPKAYKNRLISLTEKIVILRRSAVIAARTISEKDLTKRNNAVEDQRQVVSELVKAKSQQILLFDKKEVEQELQELPNKVEILRTCSLTSRQKLLYTAIKTKLNVEDLKSSNSQSGQQGWTNVMNSVVQLRKVCNHPDLVERGQPKDVFSPFRPQKVICNFPKIFFNVASKSDLSRRYLYENQCCIYHPTNIHKSLSSKLHVEDLNVDQSTIARSEWCFIKFIGIHLSLFYDIFFGEFGSSLHHVSKLAKLLELLLHERNWSSEPTSRSANSLLLIDVERSISNTNISQSEALKGLIFSSVILSIYGLMDENIYYIADSHDSNSKEQPSTVAKDQRTRSVRRLCPQQISSLLYCLCPKVLCERMQLPYISSADSRQFSLEVISSDSPELDGLSYILNGHPTEAANELFPPSFVGLEGLKPKHGWSQIISQGTEDLVSGSGKLISLDKLLNTLNSQDRHVLIYCQMTRMINLLEEYIKYRRWNYLRLDLSKAAEHGDLEIGSDIFITLSSTRIDGSDSEFNLKTIDTIIFYDANWNPTVDQQALDRVHKVCQAKELTIYRFVCEGTIEEGVIQRAREKNQLALSGGNSRPEMMKSEVLSLLFYDEELKKHVHQQQTDGKLRIIRQSQIDSQSDFQPGTSMKLRNERQAARKFTSQPVNTPDSLGATPQIQNMEQQNETELGCEMEVETMDDDDLNSSEMDEESSEEEGDAHDYDTVDGVPSTSSGGPLGEHFQSDDEEVALLSKRPKLTRGMGRRGRPPARVRFRHRDYDGRRPGRPRLKPFGPANQGIRGRGPGRPPLSKTRDTLSSYLTPTTASQSVFGCYSSPDPDLDSI